MQGEREGDATSAAAAEITRLTTACSLPIHSPCHALLLLLRSISIILAQLLRAEVHLELSAETDRHKHAERT